MRTKPRNKVRLAAVWPVRARVLSSSQVASRGWWFLFSMPHRPRTAIKASVEVRGSLRMKTRRPALVLPEALSVLSRLISKSCAA